MKQPRITKIYLENFQAISGPVEIEFGDLTFLYGPNSVGKSAVFDAIGCFREWLLDGFDENTNNPWDQARKRGKDQDLSGAMLAVGMEILVDQSQVDSVMGAYDDPGSDFFEFSVDNSFLELLRNEARIDIRLVFGNGPDSSIELRINGGDPLLVIDNDNVANFFNVLKQYLPSEYVEKTQEPYPDNHPRTRLGQKNENWDAGFEVFDDKKFFGKWNELHDSLFSLSRGYSWPKGFIPEIFPTDCCCKINLSHPLGKSLLWPQDSNTTMEDKYVKNILDKTATYRGISWDNSQSDKKHRIIFNPPEFRSNDLRNALGGNSLSKVLHLAKDAPEVFVNSPKELRQEGEEFAKYLSDLFYYLSELFRFALHSSHVSGNRSIIDSDEPVHVSSMSERGDLREFFPEHPSGVPPKFTKSPLKHLGKEASSYLGYKHAVASYASRISDLYEPEENDENGWSQDTTGKWVPPNTPEDFPNYSLKLFLPSLSRYRIYRFPYEIYQHWANPRGQRDAFSGSSLVYFQVYDAHLDSTLPFKELGSGLSFIFPILVSLGESDVSFIEQPELHLHPRAQAEIGDLLIAAKNRGNFSITESHSEQMLMRVSTRIRETTNAKSRDLSNIEALRPELEISAEDVSIYYFDPSPEPYGGTQVTRIHFTPDGSLVDDWPDGFFEKDDMTSFSRLQLFSGNVDLDKAKENWPWISEFEDTPDIVNWLSCASIVTIIEGMYAVVFPLYASKIAEKLIVEKLLEPFREEKMRDARYDQAQHKEIKKYISEDNRAPSLGQFVRLLLDVERKYKSSEDKIVTDFRNFLKERSWDGKDLLRDKGFINQLSRLAKLRNKGAHIGESRLNEALNIQSILVVGGQPGPLFKAFGYEFKA
jgi:hypothetical protein